MENIRYQPLERLNIEGEKSLLLNPDNVFWAILSKPKSRGSGEKSLSEVTSFHKKIRPGLDRKMRDFRFNTELTAIYIDPTDRCNSNCPYCYVPAKLRKSGRSMSGKELFFILERVGEYFGSSKKKPVIVFHASEPLLVKDTVFRGIKKFHKLFKFGLQTNATLLQDEDVKFLKRYRVAVGISLDSSFPSINNRLRGFWNSGGNFASATRAIEMFDGYEGLNVITTITKFNVAGLSDTVKFLHSQKVPCVLLNPLRLTQKNSRALKPNEQEMIRYFIQAVDTAIELARKSKRRIVIGNFANLVLAIIAPFARRLMCDISPCGGGRCFLTVTASGEILPCGEFIGLKGSSGGNIFKTTIKQALQSEPFKNIRARFVEKIPECRDCNFRNICGSPCPAELYSLGDMYSPAVFCEFYKAIIRYAFQLVSEGKEKYALRKEGWDSLEYEYNF